MEYTKPKEVASGNSWIVFHPKIFLSKVKIIHKCERGYIDLQISGKEINKFSGNFKNKLNEKMSIHKTGKSISVRMITPKILHINDIIEPKNYRVEIINSLNLANQLMEWCLKNILI